MFFSKFHILNRLKSSNIISQLEALLNAIPMEITFVDEDNINRYFNEGSKVFKRPVMAIDREVFSCHPPKIEAKVRRIIEEFRIGTLDEVSVLPCLSIQTDTSSRIQDRNT